MSERLNTPEACDGGADPAMNHEEHPWPCGDATALARQTPRATSFEDAARAEAERRWPANLASARGAYVEGHRDGMAAQASALDAEHVWITVRHEGGNSMRGPLGLVLRTHLAKGWELDEDIQVATMTTQPAPRTIEDGASTYVEPPHDLLVAVVRGLNGSSGGDATALAVAREVMAWQSAQTPTVDALAEAAEDVLSGWTIGSGYYETSVGTEAAAMAHAVAERVVTLRGTGQQQR